MRSTRALRIAGATALLTAQLSAQGTVLDELADLHRSGRAMRELAARGPAAIETLVEAHAATPNSQAGLVQRRRAEAAMEELVARDGAMSAAIPTLVASLDATDDARRIEAILAALGALVPYSTDPSTCDRAIQAADEHVLRLWHSTESRWTSGERSTPLIEGYRAIARMQVSAQESFERLEALLSGPDPLIRECAAERLAAYGADALPVLREALHDDHPRLARGARMHLVVDGARLVPLAASRAIARIDPEDPGATDGLLWFARHGLGHQQLAAVKALGSERLGQRNLVVHVLIPFALGDDDRLALEAITALGSLGPSASAATAALERLAAEPRGTRAQPATAALRRIRGR